MSTVSPELRQHVMGQAQGAVALNIAFIGVSQRLFQALAEQESADSDLLARRAGVDEGYVRRWCDAAFAFGYLDEQDGRFVLTDLGRAFLPDTPGSLMSFAVQSVQSAHMAERAATFMKSGERPGEKVLAERETLLPLFGPMLERSYGPLFEQHILPNVPAFHEVAERGGLVVDLGCGNGWYLRKLAHHFPGLRGVGLDGFAENATQAATLAEREGLGDRLRFSEGDIFHFSIQEPVDLITMSRALHHVWHDRDKVFALFNAHLKPGGSVVIWEPNWPEHRSDLRDPARRQMAFQNLGEHVQGNHFLRADEIEAAFRKVGMEARTYLFLNGNEAVVVGTKPLA